MNMYTIQRKYGMIVELEILFLIEYLVKDTIWPQYTSRGYKMY